MRDIKETMLIADCERLQEYRKWGTMIPSLHFEKEWSVRIIPPFGGALIRFTIDYNSKHISVYFDGYSELAWMYDRNDNPIPYFEYFDGEEVHRYFINETEQMMADIKEFLNN